MVNLSYDTLSDELSYVYEMGPWCL